MLQADAFHNLTYESSWKDRKIKREIVFLLQLKEKQVTVSAMVPFRSQIPFSNDFIPIHVHYFLENPTQNRHGSQHPRVLLIPHTALSHSNKVVCVIDRIRQWYVTSETRANEACFFCMAGLSRITRSWEGSCHVVRTHRTMW